MIKECRADDALCYIVGHTHFAVGDEQGQCARQTGGAIVAEEKAAHDYEHKGELIERGQQYVELRQDSRIGYKAVDHVVESVDGEESNYRTG